MGKSLMPGLIKNRDKPYSRFKHGQESLERDYYSKATQEVPSGEKCLDNYQRFNSDYGKCVSKTVKPGDYIVPSKDANTLGKLLFYVLTEFK